MTIRTSVWALTACVFLGAGGQTAQAQTRGSAAYVAPRAADGKADLQGIWEALDTAAWNLEDHGASAGIPAGPSVIVDPANGKIPYRPEALAKRAANFKARATADPLGKCFLPGVPRIMYLHYPFQIFQTRQDVIMAFEYVHATRTIYLDGKKHPDDIDFWMGDSRGHWDGDTLVADVGDNNDQTWFDLAGDFHSAALHVVERFTRTGPDTLQYEATIEDPQVFTRSWKIRLPLYRVKDRTQLYEYECSEYRDQAKEGNQ